MNNLGLGGINQNTDQEEMNSLQDKADYLKFSNMARDAQSKGDLKTADHYTQMAQKTYTGADLFAHHAEVVKTLPKHERNNFNYFVAADRNIQRKMLDKVSPHYRDAYEAQMNKQIRHEASVSKTLRKNDKKRMMQEAEHQQKRIRSSRAANMQSVKSSSSRYVENRARDYHNYTSAKEPSNTKDIKVASQANENSVDYTSHYRNLANAGIRDALVVIQPGLDDNASIDISVDRTEERNHMLRKWNYIK
jgi:hypothetical protein